MTSIQGDHLGLEPFGFYAGIWAEGTRGQSPCREQVMAGVPPLLSLLPLACMATSQSWAGARSGQGRCEGGSA